MKTIIRKLTGIICIILGFLALVTPLTPGSWLILVGLEILGLQFLLGDRFSRFLKKKRKVRSEGSIAQSGQDLQQKSRAAGQEEKRESA